MNQDKQVSLRTLVEIRWSEGAAVKWRQDQPDRDLIQANVGQRLRPTEAARVGVDAVKVKVLLTTDRGVRAVWLYPGQYEVL